MEGQANSVSSMVEFYTCATSVSPCREESRWSHIQSMPKQDDIARGLKIGHDALAHVER